MLHIILDFSIMIYIYISCSHSSLEGSPIYYTLGTQINPATLILSRRTNPNADISSAIGWLYSSLRSGSFSQPSLRPVAFRPYVCCSAWPLESENPHPIPFLSCTYRRKGFNRVGRPKAGPLRSQNLVHIPCPSPGVSSGPFGASYRVQCEFKCGSAQHPPQSSQLPPGLWGCTE